MKTLKYRSILASTMVAALSVFLFTSCEKESDNLAAAPEDGNRLEKFARLQFSGAAGGSTSNSGSGTFIGNGNNVQYTDADAGSIEFVPENAADQQRGFTDPMSTGPEFSIFSSVGSGGGSVTLDGKDYDLDFGFCADVDFLGFTPGSGSSDSSSGSSSDLNIFIGISGDFVMGESESSGLDLILYAFSYNGATDLGSFEDFEGGEAENAAFVIAVAFEEDGHEGHGGEPTFYFATDGSLSFAGEEVIISGAEMMKIEMGDNDHDHGDGESVDMSANLECIKYSGEE